MRIADVLAYSEACEKLDVKASRGLLFQGEPGAGKVLMVRRPLEASGREAEVHRKDEPDGSFIKTVKERSELSVAQAPSVLLLDDLDNH